MNETKDADKKEARQVVVRTGLAGVVQADEVSIESGGVLVGVAGRDLRITSGGGSILVAGGNISINSGGGSVLVAGVDMSVQNGGGGVMVTPHANLNRSFVALLLCGKADLQDGSRILLSTPQAAALGAALGLALAFTNRALRRK